MQEEESAPLNLDFLLGSPEWELIKDYDQFLQSLITWAETTIITSIKYLPPTLGRLNIDYSKEYPLATDREKMGKAHAAKNYRYLVNRKAPQYGRFYDWFNQESQQDNYTRLLNSLDEPTRIMVDDINQKMGTEDRNPLQFPVKHPLHMHLISDLIDDSWTDQNGLKLKDHEKLVTEKYLKSFENQKDTDYINKSVAEYLKADTSLYPIFVYDRYEDPDRQNPRAPTIITRITQVPRVLTGWEYLLTKWEKTQKNISYDDYDAVNELISLEELLKEMSIVLERFNLRETVLALSEFKINSIYQSDDIDEDSMQEEWKGEIRSNLDSDDRDRFDDDSSDFEYNYPFSEYVDQYSWYSPELTRSYENKVRWVWHKNRIIDGNLALITDAPSPFSKSYSPPTNNKTLLYEDSYKLERNNLTTQQWGNYATQNAFPVADIHHNDNYPLSADFIPIQIPLGPRRILNKISDDQKPHQKYYVRANEYGLDLDILFYHKLPPQQNTPISMRRSIDDYTEAILPSVDEDRYEGPQESPKIAGWEDDIGIWSMELELQLHFERLNWEPINFVLGIPSRIRDLGTN
jgi:hypothetical protein